jgi:hypothetical protein
MNVKRKNTASSEKDSFLESDFDFSRAYPNPFAQKLKGKQVKVAFVTDKAPAKKKPEKV